MWCSPQTYEGTHRYFRHTYVYIDLGCSFLTSSHIKSIKLTINFCQLLSHSHSSGRPVSIWSMQNNLCLRCHKYSLGPNCRGNTKNCVHSFMTHPTLAGWLALLMSRGCASYRIRRDPQHTVSHYLSREYPQTSWHYDIFLSLVVVVVHGSHGAAEAATCL